MGTSGGGGGMKRTFLISLQLLLLIFFILLSQHGNIILAQQTYDNCDISMYYKNLSPSPSSSSAAVGQQWSRSKLHDLVQSTHRRSLPYTNRNGDDVWKGLIDLDSINSANSGGTVHLIYRNINVPANDYGTSTTWNREHIWPKSRGVHESGPDFTDLHHMAPADWNVNAARGNDYFGSCPTVVSSDDTKECISPAHSEAAPDTATSGEIWLPPNNVRGDIARSLFYMDIRYEGDGARNELNLTLTDCPSNDNDNEMAYLSQLLQWHQDDPVTAEEKQRNDRICSKWQGNRNPFIDYPNLVTSIFGTPQPSIVASLSSSSSISTGITGPYGYKCPATETEEEVVSSTITDASDTSTTTSSSSTSNNDAAGSSTTSIPLSCNGLQPGDVMPIGFNSDDPDEIVFVALSKIQPGTTLFVTDNAWITETSSFQTNEGTLKLTVPSNINGSSGIAAGTVFGYSADTTTTTTNTMLYAGDWEKQDGRFALAAGGDTILIYCQNDDNDNKNNNNQKIIHLGGLSYSGDWVDDDDPNNSLGTDKSALPSQLLGIGAGVALTHKDNYKYNDKSISTTTSISKSELQKSITTISNWEGSDTTRYSFFDSDSKFLSSFQIKIDNVEDIGVDKDNNNNNAVVPPQPPSSSLPLSESCQGLSAGDVMPIGFNSDDPDEVVLLTLVDLDPGISLFMTDNAWTGSSFLSNEGTLKLTIPSSGAGGGGILSGTVFGYSSNISNLLFANDWEKVEGRGFALAAAGDTIFIYCMSYDNIDEGSNNNNNPKIVHLGGLSYSGNGWAAADLSSYGTDQSALPSSLSTGGAITLTQHKDNYKYIINSDDINKEKTKSEIQKSIATPSNWEGSDTTRYSWDTSYFLILDDDDDNNNNNNNADTSSTSSSPSSSLTSAAAAAAPSPSNFLLFTLISLPLIIP